MSTSRRSRRQIAIAAMTVLAFVAIAVPVAASRTLRQFTVWPGNDARFANLDWNCHYYTLKKGIQCGRESMEGGIRLEVTGDTITVMRCKIGTVKIRGVVGTDCTKNLLV